MSLTSTLQRYRNDINILSPYRIHSNNTDKRRKKISNSNFDINSHRDLDLKRPQMSLNDLKIPQSTSNVKSLTNKIKNVLKGASTHENVEINEHYLDEILHNINT